MAKLAQVATARQAQLKDGRRLGFAEFGDPQGQPVLFFHDLWGNRKQRHPDDDILHRLGLRLIGVDRPGYGLSTRKPERGIMDVVDDAMLLSKALKLETFAVLGYSAGGPYALALAYRFPQIVRRCAVVSSLPPLDNPRGYAAIAPIFARALQLAQGMEPALRMALRGAFALDSQSDLGKRLRELTLAMPAVDQRYLAENPALHEARRAMWEELRQNGSDILVDEMLTLIQPWNFHLQSIRVPVDIWWGGLDGFVAPLVGRRMAALIPDARLEMIPQAGHLLIFSRWRAILQRLTQSADS